MSEPTLCHSLLHPSMSKSQAASNSRHILVLGIVHVLRLQNKAYQSFASSNSNGFHIPQRRSDRLILEQNGPQMFDISLLKYGLVTQLVKIFAYCVKLIEQGYMSNVHLSSTNNLLALILRFNRV